MTLDYFYNEKGDYTLTVDGTPVGILKDKEIADDLVNYISDINADYETQIAAEKEKLAAELAKEKAYIKSVLVTIKDSIDKL